MANIPKPQFPNVPSLPGVPQVARSPRFPASPPPALSSAVAIGRLALSFLGRPVWGIFKNPPPTSVTNGIETATSIANPQPVVIPDSIRDFGYRQENTMPNYPVQDGSFASYNKVATPFEASVRMSKGSGQSILDTIRSTVSSASGGRAARTRFLEQLDAIVGTTDLYQIRTPEKNYLNCNVLGYEFTRRGAEGAYFLTEVDVYFQEIRTVVAQYNVTATNTQNAKNASAQPKQNNGTVNGQQVTQ